jgi:alpha-amylase/alpha-mannosidase (GH57 family)
LITLNFIWHQHQPDYRQPTDGVPILPWVRLHAVKGYSDLLNILERYEHARCCVNFSGILLEQLSLTAEGRLTDRYAELSLRPAAELEPAERVFLLRYFFAGNPTTLIAPHSRYYELFAKRESLTRLAGLEAAVERFSVQELTDIQVWFNLAWIGFCGQKRSDVRDLIVRGREFSLEDQRQVLAIHGEMLQAVLPGYRALAEQGRIELTCTPYHHPILPLICDLAAEGHHEASDPLPEFRYPQDAAEHVRRGMEWFQRCFGHLPSGAWPAEGSVSDAALTTLASAGLAWAATDQQNLPSYVTAKPLAHMTPWCWEKDGSRLHVFFRDTRLADNIGFEYASWQPALAGKHLVNMALTAGMQSGYSEPVVTIALDGENPWEAYLDGGERFLSAVFENVADEATACCKTPSEILAGRDCPVIHSVSAGSWICGNFDIWSRHPETRVAWRRLAKARNDLVDVYHDAVQEHLLAAEGSDWFWWYGDDFTTELSVQFDELFRGHLIAAYETAGRPVPEEMYSAIVSERLPEAPGEVLSLIEPRLDGRVTSYYEWQGAVRVAGNYGQSSMARSAAPPITALHYGFSAAALYLRLDLTGELREKCRQGCRVVLHLAQGSTTTDKEFVPSAGQPPALPDTQCALDQIVELRLDLAATELRRGTMALLLLELFDQHCRIARFPVAGRLPVRIVPAEFAEQSWFV